MVVVLAPMVRLPDSYMYAYGPRLWVAMHVIMIRVRHCMHCEGGSAKLDLDCRLLPYMPLLLLSKQA